MSQSGAKCGDQRLHNLVEGPEVHVAGRAGRERQVAGGPRARPAAGLVEASGARVQRPLVQRDVQNPRIRQKISWVPLP